MCHFWVTLYVLLDTKSNENTRAVDIGGDMIRVGASGGTGWLMSARGEFQSTGVGPPTRGEEQKRGRLVVDWDRGGRPHVEMVVVH